MTFLLSIILVLLLAAWWLRLSDEAQHRRNVRRTLRLIENWYGQ